VSRTAALTFYEFFAGGGMARAGLADGWSCLLSNDFDPAKAAVYRANWGDEDLRVGDIWALTAGDVPGQADLAWASSPCQDFSLAGGRAGLGGGRSSAFFGFWRLIEQLDDDGRAPRALVIENVTGLLSSRGGQDFAALGAALVSRGYRFGALEIDAAAFTPQSRPRLFVVAARTAPAALRGDSPFHSRGVRRAFDDLPDALQEHWVWWRLSAPDRRNLSLADVLEPDARVRWHTPQQTGRLLDLMAAPHRLKVEAALAAKGRRIGALCRRTRVEGGVRAQRAEVRFDDLAGCLRTPRGGSSRQAILVVENGRVRSRLLTGREGARLMGLPEDYRLPPSANAALHVIGDGVAVPVVRRLAEQLLEPLLLGPSAKVAAA
jgi:DNA (cytosine-5)-methyltransferase 1